MIALIKYSVTSCQENLTRTGDDFHYINKMYKQRSISVQTGSPKINKDRLRFQNRISQILTPQSTKTSNYSPLPSVQNSKAKRINFTIDFKQITFSEETQLLKQNPSQPKTDFNQEAKKFIKLRDSYSIEDLENLKKNRKSVFANYISQSFIEQPSDEEQSKPQMRKFISIHNKPTSPHKRQIFPLKSNEIARFHKWRDLLEIDSFKNQVFEVIYDNYVNILISAQLRQETDIINYSVEIIESCVRYKQPIQLSQILRLLSYYFHINKEPKKSCFFAKQSFTLCLFMQLYNERIKCLYDLIKICLNQKMYQQGIIFAMDALSYAWLVNNQELEILIYDQLGLALYYSSAPQEAQYFHLRFAKGFIQPHDSYIRQNTINSTTLREQLELEAKERYKVFNSIVLSKLRLPKAFSGGNQNRQNYQTSDGLQLIRDLAEQVESFQTLTVKQFGINEEVSRNPNHFIFTGGAPEEAVPQIILDIKRRHAKFDNKYNLEAKQKVPNVKMQLETRLSQKYNYEALLTKIHQNVQFTQNCKAQQMYKVLVKQSQNIDSYAHTKMVHFIRSHLDDILKQNNK